MSQSSHSANETALPRFYPEPGEEPGPFVRMLCIFGALGGLLSGCAPTVMDIKFSSDPTVPEQKMTRLPLKAAIIASDSFQNAVTEYTATCPTTVTSYDLKLPVGEYSVAAFQKILSQTFETVEIAPEKTQAIGHFDFLIEPESPQLIFDRNCIMQTIYSTIILPVAPYGPWLDPFISAQVSLNGKIMDGSGQAVLGEASYKSGEFIDIYDKEPGFKKIKLEVIKSILEKELTTAVVRITSTLLSKPKVQEHVRLQQATMLARKQTRDSESVAMTVVKASDVDQPPGFVVPSQRTRHAVIIGIERYRQKLPNADYATHDAQVVSEYATKVLGVPEENLALLLNEHATKNDLEKYMESWLPNRVEREDSVFIFYSGHGAPSAKSGKAYMVPFDGDPAFIDQTGYPLGRLYERLNKLPAKEIVIVLDSCFSGAGGRSVIAKGMRPVGLSVETPASVGGATVVLAASSGDQVSSTYDAKGHGLLTYFFLKGLQGAADQDKDRQIGLAELFNYVKPQVERIARREYNNEQTPQLLGRPEMLKHGIPLLTQPLP